MAVRKRPTKFKPRAIPKRKPKNTDLPEIIDAIDSIDTDSTKVMLLIGRKLNVFPINDATVMEAICMRFDARIETLQINYPKCPTFRVFLSFTEVFDWKDYPASRKSYYAGVTHTSLVYAVVKTYLTVCKFANRWIGCRLTTTKSLPNGKPK